MHNVRNITEDLYWIGANDRRLALLKIYTYSRRSVI